MSGIEHLFEEVLDASVSSDWDEAVNEWDVVGIDGDGNHDTSCICGKEGLRYLFTIQNRFNGNELFPIGSKCIGKLREKYLVHNKEHAKALAKTQISRGSALYGIIR